LILITTVLQVQLVAEFVAVLPEWNVTADFVSTHLYPTDFCNTKPDARSNLDCFTDQILKARAQAKGHTFLITEFNCGWKNDQVGVKHAVWV
jgi:hypothetical protein